MRKIIYIVLFSILVAACSPLKFDRYAGEALQEIPEAYRGRYVNPSIAVNDSDTVMLYISNKSYTITDKSETSIEILDENHVFSTYKNKDFLFIKEDGAWSGFQMSKKKNKLTIVPLIGPMKSDTTKDVKILKRFFADVVVLNKNSNIDKYSYAVKMDDKKLLKYINKIKKHKVVFTQVQE